MRLRKQDRRVGPFEEMTRKTTQSNPWPSLGDLNHAGNVSSAPKPRIACEHMFVTSQGGVYPQFKRALRGRHVIAAWGLAAELPSVPLADALELLLLARDLEPARFDRGVPRWHARLCMERRLSAGEAQLALAALAALPGPGAVSAAQALAALCEAHGLEREALVLEGWVAARSYKAK
jgi:hypothetical protein